MSAVWKELKTGGRQGIKNSSNNSNNNRGRRSGSSAWKRWLARRELSDLIATTPSFPPASGSNIPQQHALRCLLLLRRHPLLAQKRYLKNWDGAFFRPNRVIYPLTYFLELGEVMPNYLTIIREVYDMYPAALTQEIHGQCPILAGEPAAAAAASFDSMREYPLHIPCLHGRLSSEAIIFLAKACPMALRTRDKFGKLPLHLLLWNQMRSATVEEIETFLDLFPEALTVSCPFGTPILMAIKNPKVTRDVEECLFRRMPKHVKELHLGGNMHRDARNRFRILTRHDARFTRMELHHAQAVSKLLPQLETFSCAPCEWSTDAFHHLMANICDHENVAIVDLTLHMPPSLVCHNGDATPRTIQRLLEHNQSLEILEIDFGSDASIDDEALAFFSGGIQKCLRHLVAGLSQNDSLKVLHLGGSLMTHLTHFFRKEFWPGMANILQERNTSLEWIRINNLQTLPMEGKKVLNWTRLNRHGRAIARDPGASVYEIVNLLENAGNRTSDNPSIAVDRLNLLYGLLHECPTLWSRTHG